MGGAKQPQQFFIAAYFLDNLDLVVNIDGFIDGFNDTQGPTSFPFIHWTFPYYLYGFTIAPLKEALLRALVG